MRSGRRAGVPSSPVHAPVLGASRGSGVKSPRSPSRHLLCRSQRRTSMLERCATCGDTKRGAAHKVCRLRSLAEETDDDADNAAGGGGRRLCGVAVVGSVACGCPARVALRGGKERARAGAKRANRLGEDDRNPAVTTKVCFTLRERALGPTGTCAPLLPSRPSGSRGDHSARGPLVRDFSVPPPFSPPAHRSSLSVVASPPCLECAPRSWKAQRLCEPMRL